MTKRTAVRLLLALSTGVLLVPISGCVLDEPDDGPDDTPPWTPSETEGSNLTPCHPELEPNSGPNETTCVSLDSTLTASLSSGDEDWYMLSIPDEYALNKVSIKAEDSNQDCFTGVDPYIEVGSSELILLYRSEDTFEDYCPRLSFPVIAGETYLIRVATLWSLSGPYTLTVSQGGPGSISGTVSLASKRTSTPAYSPWQAQVELPWQAAERLSPPRRPAASIPVEPGELLLRLHDGHPTRRLFDDLRRREGLQVVRERPIMGGRYLHLALESTERKGQRLSQAETWALAARLRSWAGVVSADVNRVLEPQQIPNDSYYEDQWDLGPFPGMNLPGAWEISLGLESVVVAVIDSGNESSHPDLNDKWVVGYDFISNAQNAGDGSAEDAVPEDNLRQGHGAHVTGTIAAETDNGVGIAGIGWQVSYMPLRVCGNYGCTEADITEALYYAAGYETVAEAGQSSARVHVANLSLGGHDFCSPMLQDVISAAESRGVVVVVSAGNSADDAREYTPASCQGVITVGASDELEQRASFSNYGDAAPPLRPWHQHPQHRGWRLCLLARHLHGQPPHCGLGGPA